MLQLFSIHVWIKFLEALGRTSPGPFIISYVKLWSAVIMKSTVGWIVHFSSTSFLFLNSVYPVTKIGNEMTTGCIRKSVTMSKSENLNRCKPHSEIWCNRNMMKGPTYPEGRNFQNILFLWKNGWLKAFWQNVYFMFSVISSSHSANMWSTTTAYVYNLDTTQCIYLDVSMYNGMLITQITEAAQYGNHDFPKNFLGDSAGVLHH